MPGQPKISIPAELLPKDGRFGSGPSRIPLDALSAFASDAPHLLGTSHRQLPVKSVVADIRAGLTDMYLLPDGYEVVLGVGGATAFWDAAAFGLIEERSAHFVCGEFSSKFAAVTAGAPFLGDPVVIERSPPDAPAPAPVDGVDTTAFIHNETSTGVMAAFDRFGDEVVLVDGTSAAGAIPVNAEAVDVYYFSPQKAFASEGGLWVALVSPKAVDRIERVAASTRWVPPSLALDTAISNSRKNQTYNTPSLTTLYLLRHQIQRLVTDGGLSSAYERCLESAGVLYGWALDHPLASPFVEDLTLRSPTIATIDVDDSVDALEIAGIMRANGIVDIESYRKLGRNQLRVAMFPAISTAEIERLTQALTYVIEALAG